MNLPLWCLCGRIVTFSNASLCEDCWANEQSRLRLSRNGKSRLIQNVRTTTFRGPEVVHESSSRKMRPYRQSE